MIGSVSRNDPYYLGSVPGVSMNYDARGKTPRSPLLVPDERTAVLIVAGQSNCANTVDSLYTPTAAKVDNFNQADGGTYAFVDSPVGCSGFGGSWLGRLGDKLIAAGIFDRVIFAPIGVSATSITQWAPGGVLNQNLVSVCRRLMAAGLAPSAFLWQQGESDHGMSQGTYQTHLGNVIGTPRADGFNAPWLIAKCTLIAGSTDASVRAAQAAVINNTDIFAGPDSDALSGATYRQTGGGDPHFNATGADAVAGLWKTALDAIF